MPGLLLLPTLHCVRVGDSVGYFDTRTTKHIHIIFPHSQCLHSGALQGSVIGPLLYLLFVNDLPDVLEALTLLFADDNKMITRRSQSMNLHSSLTAAWDWSKKWDLPINPIKCKYPTIG